MEKKLLRAQNRDNDFARSQLSNFGNGVFPRNFGLSVNFLYARGATPAEIALKVLI
jgi:hypothetical protein